MTDAAQTAKADLHRYLNIARDSMVWKLDGLSEYDARRPLVRTGTNLLGLVKHVASVDLGYFGETFGRRGPDALENKPWLTADDPTGDMWASADESRAEILDFYRDVRAHSDVTIETLDLDAVGHVPWWPAERSEVSLHRILVHMIAETDRHAGHADIVRELIDGQVGLRADNPNLREDFDWASFRDQIEAAARAAGS